MLVHTIFLCATHMIYIFFLFNVANDPYRYYLVRMHILINMISTYLATIVRTLSFLFGNWISVSVPIRMHMDKRARFDCRVQSFHCYETNSKLWSNWNQLLQIVVWFVYMTEEKESGLSEGREIDRAAMLFVGLNVSGGRREQ